MVGSRGNSWPLFIRVQGYEMVAVPKLEDLIGIAEGADTTSYRDRYDRY